MPNNKKGDLFDGMLHYAAIANDPSHFSDYPERVLLTLRTFYNVWKVPEFSIPSRKSRSKLEQWILELDELNNICPASQKMEIAMQKTLEKYNTFKTKYSVTHPASIRNLLVDAVAEIKRSEVEDTKKEIIQVASQKEINKTIKDMESMFNDEEA